MLRPFYLISLLFISVTPFSGCKSTTASGRLDVANNQTSTTVTAPQVLPRVEQYINCLNNYDAACLHTIYAEDYKSYSPVLTPADLDSFVRETIDNLRKNNFAVAIKIKDIEQGLDRATVVMDWQLKVKGASAVDHPFANVQRIDLWKLDKQNKWRIFRTVIYHESAF